MRPTTETLTTLAALAEPNRLRIVELLRGGPLAVGEIGERLGLRQPQVSKHLKVLKEAGLADVRVDAQRRLYALRQQRFAELDAWLEPYVRAWNARLDALERRLEDMEDESPAAIRRKRGER
jgi:DNA-binding transcriptional ArsR family regulator